MESKNSFKNFSILFYNLRLTHVKTVGKSVTLSSKKKIVKIHLLEFALYDVQPSEVLQWKPVPTIRFKLDNNGFDIQINDFIDPNKVYCFRLVCDIEYKNQSREFVCSSISSMFKLDLMLLILTTREQLRAPFVFFQSPVKVLRYLDLNT